MTPDYSRTPDARLEYRGGRYFRVLHPDAPVAGHIVFTRLADSETRPDSRGRPGSTVVEVVTQEGRTLLPAPICRHSETGFGWGYHGSGPADLAANVLALFVPLKEAWRLHQLFKSSVIAQVSQEEPAPLAIEYVRGWLRAQWDLEETEEAIETAKLERLERERRP